MQMIKGGLRPTNKRRYARWWTLAISVLALAFPATAIGATNLHEHAISRPVLAPGSGYGSPQGSPLVRVVQRRLESAGYPPGGIDGLYGPRTREAVLAFQASHGLQVDGVVGPRTWAALGTPILFLGPGAGDQTGGSNVVRSLQRRLASAGDLPGPIDGRFGALTDGAVRRFQRAHGLSANGTAGPRTLALLAGSALSTQPARSARRSRPHPLKSRPAIRPSSAVSRPSSAVSRPSHVISVPAPAHQPANTRTKTPLGSGQSHGSRSFPWMTLLGLLALVLALILVAPLLATVVRRRRRRDVEGLSVATATGAATPVAATNGAHNRTNGRHDQASRAVQTEDVSPEAAADFDLGRSLESQGSLVEAQAAYRRADERGHGAAASNLGRLLEEQGALVEAEAAYRRADQRGDPDGAFGLGVALHERNPQEAAAAYRRAIDRGNDPAASNLGALLAEGGAMADAEVVFREADERGDPTASFNLGVLFEQRGALIDAENAYRRARQRGSGEIANMARAALLDLNGQENDASMAGARQRQNA